RKAPPVEQVHSGAPNDTAATGLLERAALSARIPARVFRDEFSAAAPARGEPRPSGCVLHARLQPGLDESGWFLVDGDADGLAQDRTACRADPNLERDGLVRRLRAADGPRHGTARRDEPGNARGAVDRLPPAGAA